MTRPLTARIEVFRPGTFKPMAGEAITYSAADLKAVADSYDPATAPAPVVIGHPTTDAPAYGWVEAFDYDSQEERLFATIGEIEPQFAELVKAGRFKKVSMAFFCPDQAHNPVAGAWYPKHLGFLGGAAPGVPGLKNAQFAGEAGVVFNASFGVAQEAAGLFGSLRDFFIDQFGLESADQALPRWRIDWLEQADDPKTHFAAPPAIDPKPEKEKPVAPPPNPAFAEREAGLSAREQAVAAREAAAAHIENVAFAEGLVTVGRLLPVARDKLVAILDALPGEATVAFAQGAGKLSPAAAIREILKEQPVVSSSARWICPRRPVPAGPLPSPLMAVPSMPPRSSCIARLKLTCAITYNGISGNGDSCSIYFNVDGSLVHGIGAPQCAVVYGSWQVSGSATALRCP